MTAYNPTVYDPMSDDRLTPQARWLMAHEIKTNHPRRCARCGRWMAWKPTVRVPLQRAAPPRSNRCVECVTGIRVMPDIEIVGETS